MVAIIAIVGALEYARGSAQVVVYRLLTDGSIALAWVASAAGTGAFFLHWLLGEDVAPDGKKTGTVPNHRVASEVTVHRRTNGLLYFVTSAALGVGMIGLATLGLGLAGLLNQITAIALLLPGLPLGWLALRARARNRTPSPYASTTRPSYWHWLWLAAAPFLAVSLIGTMVPPGLLWNPEEPHGYDVVEYHLQVPREWYEAGRIVPLKHNVFSYFPMGVEVHYLLAMEIDGGPWEGMYLTQLMHLSLIVLTVLAAWGVAMQFASNRPSAAVAAVALATMPWMAQLGAIAYNEGGLLLYGTLAIGWAMQGLAASAGPRSRLRRFALAGAMAGFACGTKLTAVPELLLGVPAACIAILLFRGLLGAMGLAGAMGKRTRLPVEGVAQSAKHGQASTLAHGTQSGSFGDRPILKSMQCGMTVSVVFGIAGLLTFAPWLARNAAWTGNPVFPEAVNLLGKARLTEVQVERWKRANHEPGLAERGAIGHARAVWDQLLADWQFGYLLLPLGVLSVIRLVANPPGAAKPPVGAPAALKIPKLTADPTATTDTPRQDPLPNPPPEYRGREQEGWPAMLPAVMLLFLAIFWVGFTHLQSRFFLLAGPLAVMLIAQADWGRWLRPVAGLILVAALIGWWGINKRFIDIVWKPAPDMRTSLVDGLGRNDLQWLNAAELDAFPRTPEALRDDPNAHVLLVGDSRAFWYQIPMSRLRCRTVFDLDTSALPAAPTADDLIGAWAGRVPRSKPPPGEWVVIDGAELERFSRTYYGVPPPPRQWRGRTTPLVVRPDR